MLNLKAFYSCWLRHYLFQNSKKWLLMLHCKRKFAAFNMFNVFFFFLLLQWFCFLIDFFFPSWESGVSVTYCIGELCFWVFWIQFHYQTCLIRKVVLDILINRSVFGKEMEYESFLISLHFSFISRFINGLIF